MKQAECIAMILAGGRGTRLGSLTKATAKPAVTFGGSYRIIDFTLSNCRNSGISAVGVLTQYLPAELHSYIGGGETWGFADNLFLCPPKHGGEYSGTADAIYENIDFIDGFDPEHVLVLSGDHIYKMDYSRMLEWHKRANADVTIAVTPVPLSEASRFGILSASEDGRITSFEEKPINPRSNLASMGIYVFKWSSLKRYLAADNADKTSAKDFGKNIIPSMLSAGENMHTYSFSNYWRDVGTVHSLWESNMDLISEPARFNMREDGWEIFANARFNSPCYIAGSAYVSQSIIAERCTVYGSVERSVLSDSVRVCAGAEITESVIMPGAVIGKNAIVYRAVIGANVFVGENSVIGDKRGINLFVDEKMCSENISLVAPRVYVAPNARFQVSSHIDGNTSHPLEGYTKQYASRFDARPRSTREAVSPFA